MLTGSFRSPGRMAAECAALLTVALALAYIESLLPTTFLGGIPGAKLGLANLAVLVALDRGGIGMASAVSLSRVVLSALLFGSVSSLLFSLSGALLALLVMAVLRLAGEKISYIGVSVLSAAAHNVGQLGCAFLLFHEAALLSYLPALFLFAAVSGALIGALANRITRLLPAGQRRGDSYA